jgi:hypothetical protein
MADIRIVIGRKYEVMHDERRQTTTEFADGLRSSGLSVELEVIEYEPGRYGLTPVEWTAFFIGTSVASSLLNDLTTDLYNGAKKLLRSRREGKKADSGSPGRHLGFIIYGPDGKVIEKWTTQEDGTAPGDAGKPSEDSKPTG